MPFLFSLGLRLCVQFNLVAFARDKQCSAYARSMSRHISKHQPFGIYEFYLKRDVILILNMNMCAMLLHAMKLIKLILSEIRQKHEQIQTVCENSRKRIFQTKRCIECACDKRASDCITAPAHFYIQFL